MQAWLKCFGEQLCQNSIANCLQRLMQQVNLLPHATIAPRQAVSQLQAVPLRALVIIKQAICPPAQSTAVPFLMQLNTPSLLTPRPALLQRRRLLHLQHQVLHPQLQVRQVLQPRAQILPPPAHKTRHNNQFKMRVKPHLFYLKQKRLDFARKVLYNNFRTIRRCDGIGRRDGLKIR